MIGADHLAASLGETRSRAFRVYRPVVEMWAIEKRGHPSMSRPRTPPTTRKLWGGARKDAPFFANYMGPTIGMLGPGFALSLIRLLPSDVIVAPFEMETPVVLPVTTELPIRKVAAPPLELRPVPLFAEVEWLISI